VQVRDGVNHSSVIEGNCVVARQGENQLEMKCRSAGNELDSACCNDEPSAKWRSLKIINHAGVVAKAMIGLQGVVGGGTTGRYDEVSWEA
jgi:hypothetical protein